MTNKELFGEPGRIIAYNPDIAILMGNDVDSALLLSQLLYWRGKQQDKKTGWIRKSQSEIWAETGLTRSRQEGARKRLREANFILECHIGVSPPKTGFKLCIDNIRQAWQIYQSDPKAAIAQIKAAKPHNLKRTQPGNIPPKTARHREQNQLDEEPRCNSMNCRLPPIQSALSLQNLYTGDDYKDDNRDRLLLPLPDVSSSATLDDNREARLPTSASPLSVEGAKSARLNSATESLHAAPLNEDDSEDEDENLSLHYDPFAFDDYDPLAEEEE